MCKYLNFEFLHLTGRERCRRQEDPRGVWQEAGAEEPVQQRGHKVRLAIWTIQFPQNLLLLIIIQNKGDDGPPPDGATPLLLRLNLRRLVHAPPADLKGKKN